MKIAIVALLVVSSAVVLALLFCMLWAVIVGSEWSEYYGWGEDENDK